VSAHDIVADLVNHIEAATTQLLKERATLLAKQDELRTELRAIDRQLEKLRAAVAPHAKRRTGEPPALTLATTIEDAGFDVRIGNALWSADVKTVADLVARSELDLLRMHNLGRKSVLAIRDRLADAGLKLRDAR
jgi:DNA-directed RNA polymerase alpha subunit